jgi:hypothetical protein
LSMSIGSHSLNHRAPPRSVGGVMFLRGSRQFEVGTIGEMEPFSASGDQIG